MPDEIAAHLAACDADFLPPLSTRVTIGQYARKISAHAERLEAWANGSLIGLMAMYCNAPDQSIVFLTNLSVLPEWRGHGIAMQLMKRGIRHACLLKFSYLELEINPQCHSAYRLYSELGFRVRSTNGKSQTLSLRIDDDLSPPRLDEP